jgi:CRP-like cAMP-binding protein
MYFLGEGTAFILSPNERRVLSILEMGSYFGELSLYIRTFRLSPIIASTFCIVYVLRRTAFQNLLKKFPAFEAEYSYSCIILNHF